MENHLLRPLVVGRIVRLHPLAIILMLAVGGIIAGIAGAIVAADRSRAGARLAAPAPGTGPDADGSRDPPGSAP